MKLTPYEDVNQLLILFLSNLKKILGKRLVGFYLYGSLAINDFDDKSSDIDFVVVTETDITEVEFKELKKMHQELINQEGWGKKLEGAYMSRAGIKKYSPAYKQPFLSEVTPFSKIQLDFDWVLNRAMLRQSGIAIYGPPLSILIDPVSKDQVKQAAYKILTKSWDKHVKGPKWMHKRKTQAFTVLTMCRAIYAVKYGETVSKSQAAQWALSKLDPEWSPLINWALTSRHDLTVDRRLLPETLKFLRYVITLAK